MKELFAQPALFAALREHVVSRLRTYPSILVWHPGCDDGGAAFSTAIVLYEAGLLDRAQIYATDADSARYEAGAAGRYPPEGMDAAEARYREAGGASALAEYFQIETVSADDTRVVMRPLLRRHVHFLEHDLTGDGSFNEFQLIVDLAAVQGLPESDRERALGLFHDSLCRSGLVALGDGESLAHSPALGAYAAIDGAPRLWRRVR